ncbi:flavin reductase [Streptomyces sp. NPDC012746]|uniref:flavin reductase family protein n=1 Tax=Streptomyces sp. NPDC012746 TaxID=3364845 RepID=UPI003686E4F3
MNVRWTLIQPLALTATLGNGAATLAKSPYWIHPALTKDCAPRGGEAQRGAVTEIDPFTDNLDGPMYVVTVASGAERAGCLVGFASQCSIDPPRFTVWLSIANHTYRVARQAEYLTLHLLHRNDRALAELFGGETGDQVDKFARIGWRPGESGSPILE